MASSNSNMLEYVQTKHKFERDVPLNAVHDSNI